MTSPNTQAILLLTAPLRGGRPPDASPKPLTLKEYNHLAQKLREANAEPADLLGEGAPTLLESSLLDGEQLRRLLDRGFLLSQAMERWSSRAIQVASRADPEYPKRLKRLKQKAPPILYFCGRLADLDAGGLAVVGSRNVGDDLIVYAGNVGNLAAQARRPVVSGGARGVDQAAMRGALDAGGKGVCVLPGNLDRAVTRREYRDAALDGRLVLVSPDDPATPFAGWRAMERNKYIYALADAALVVNAERNKGGTWAGAVEHLDRHRFVPVYVRAAGPTGAWRDALLERGARKWPDPESPDALGALLAETPVQQVPASATSPAEELFAKATELLLPWLREPRTESDTANRLDLQKGQARSWLKRLVADGKIETLSRPVRYRAVSKPQPARTLFNQNSG